MKVTRRNYLDQIAWRLGEIAPGCDFSLLRGYALLALVKGKNVTEADVHHAWVMWPIATKPEHPSLVPFAELPADVQQLSDFYVDAIQQVSGEPVVVAHGDR